MSKQNDKQNISTPMERRTVNMTELRVITDNNGTDGTSGTSQPIIEGHAAVFNSWSEELGGMFPFREKIIEGAFADSIQVDDVRALFNHDPNYVLDRNKAGTLELQETQNGLWVKINPPDTQWARDLMISISRGDINQMSFGFLVLEDRWGFQDGIEVRELHKVKLFDVSPVTFPAYTQTDVGVRGALESYERHVCSINEADCSRAKQQLELLKYKFKLL